MRTSAQTLLQSYDGQPLEAGCDEAGRGCLAGPVFAAAVILPPGFTCPGLNDSKKLSAVQRSTFRNYIENSALAWAVGMADNKEIDQINILKASFLAMHRAIAKLQPQPQLLLIDGNRFQTYSDIPHHCIVGGDGKYMSIAAASVLAKTHRDEYMMQIHQEFMHFGWNTNKGYPTAAHIAALHRHGPSPYHRLSFHLKGQLQLRLDAYTQIAEKYTR